MRAPVYTYAIHDLRSNVFLDELPLTGVTFNTPLNGCGALQATWDLSRHPSTTRRDPYDLTAPARRAIYVLRDRVPMWGGIIWTSNYDSESQRIALGAADWWSYFDHRKVIPVLQANPPQNLVAKFQVIAENKDQNDIARFLLNVAQNHANGDLGIEPDESLSGIYRDRTYHGYSLVDVGEAWRKLSEVIDGPDMVFGVAAPGADGKPRRVFRQGTPTLGQQGSPHVFEYGGNIAKYGWPRNASPMRTRTFASGEGQAEGLPIAVRENPDAYAMGYLLTEGEEGYSSVSTGATLQAHADADAFTYRLPVVLPTLVVNGGGRNAPRIGEFGPGDDCRVVIKDPYFRSGLDTSARIVDIAYRPSVAPDLADVTLSPLTDEGVA